MRFSETHEWVKVEGESAKVGISDYAQKELGEIVYVELPKLNSTLKAHDLAVVLESTKAAVDIYSPVSGKVTAINEQLKDNPQLVNSSAESDGWLFEVTLVNPKELDSLLDQKQYNTSLGS